VVEYCLLRVGSLCTIEREYKTCETILWGLFSFKDVYSLLKTYGIVQFLNMGYWLCHGNNLSQETLQVISQLL